MQYISGHSISDRDSSNALVLTFNVPLEGVISVFLRKEENVNLVKIRGI